MKFRLTFIGWYLVFIVVAIITLVVCCSCTEHTRTRSWGSEKTVTLPSGMRLLEVTWNGINLWYLLEPMDSNYIPKTKIFKKDSQSGMREYTVKFIECR